MTDLWVDAAEGQAGRMPARGVRTGARCITRTPLRVSVLPPVLEWLTWTGLWPRSRHDPRRTVVVSLLPGRIRALGALTQVRDLTAALLLPLLIATVVSDAPFVVGLLQATLLVKLLVGVIGSVWAPHARIDASGEWVHITRIHADAAAAAEQVMTRPDSMPVPKRIMSLSTVTSAIGRDGG